MREKRPVEVRVWQQVGISNSRCPVAVGRAYHGLSVADLGDSTSTISPFGRRLARVGLPIPQGNAESRTLDGRLSFPGISGKYLDRAVSGSYVLYLTPVVGCYQVVPV